MAGIDWTEKDLEVLRARYPDEGAPVVAKALDRTPGSVSQMAHRQGLRRSHFADRLHKNYSVDADAFRELNPKTAYVLGLIVADGNVTGDLLKFSNTDLNAMQVVRSAIGSNHPLTADTKPKVIGYNLSIRNKRLVDGVRQWGVTDNKSLTGSLPTVPDELFPHLLRGYFDGDGHVNYSYRGGLRMKFTSGSHLLLETLAADIDNHIGVSAPDVQADKGRPNALRLWYYGNRAAQIGAFMYGAGGWSMERKRKVFDAYAHRSDLAA